MSKYKNYFWWKPNEVGYDFNCNFGDDLFYHIACRISRNNITWGSLGSSERLVFLGGSVLQMIRGGDISWGPGFRQHEVPGDKFSKVKLLACRGHLTKNLLKKYDLTDMSLGDPGILTSHLFPEWEVAKNYDLGFIPHFTDYDKYANGRQKFNGLLIDPRNSAKAVVEKITQCKCIISQSLHGIIVAESFGIPSVPLATSEPEFKYEDYYSLTNRSYNYVHNLEKAIEAVSEKSVPSHHKYFNKLISSFPKENIIEDSYIYFNKKVQNKIKRMYRLYFLSKC
jgi:pyruvyltransferase